MKILRAVVRWTLIPFSALALAGILLAAGLALYVLPGLPAVSELKRVQYHVPLRVFSAEGDLLAEFGEKRRVPLKIDEIPLALKRAVIAAEDDRFYEHPGVDYQGILRAAFSLVKTQTASQGGSTITMQVARNFFLNRERTFWRKFREMLLALQIEKKLSKDEILALYLNQNYMGKRAYGVGAAAQTYYGVDVSDLNLAQIAMMAGLYKAPSKYNPIANPERARLRRNYVLRRMYEKGYITREDFRAAANAPLTARVHAARVDVEAGYVAEMVRAYLYRQYGDDVYSMGLKVTTTISTRLQQEANLALRKALIDYDHRHGYRGPEATYALAGKTTRDYDHILENHPTYGGLRAALVIESDAGSASLYLGDGEVADLDMKAVRWARPYIDEDHRGPRPKRVDQVLKPGDLVRLARSEQGWRLSQLPEVGGALVSISAIDGRIFALTGGFDYYYSRFNRVTQAVRQPGSNFKPFVYSAALAKGFTPASVFNDAPIVHETEINGEERLWRPDNYSGKFQGPTRLRMALAHSKNLVSIRLLQKVGVQYALRHIRKFEMTKRPMPADLSLALGTGSLTPLELISGYAVFANQGYRVEPWFIEKIEDRDGNLIYRHAPFVACEAPCENLVTPEMVKLHPEVLENSHKIYGRPARRVMDRDNMFQMVSMLKDVIRVGTGRKARVLRRNDLAGKTGTTNDQRDAWFSGFNREIVTTVWIGFDQHKPLGKRETGGHLALPAWIDYMRVALRDSPQRPWKMPEDLVTVKIDPETGLRAGPDTRNPVFEIFRPDHVPEEVAVKLAPTGADVPEQIF